MTYADFVMRTSKQELRTAVLLYVATLLKQEQQPILNNGQTLPEIFLHSSST
jgi:hypothetical protein